MGTSVIFCYVADIPPKQNKIKAAVKTSTLWQPAEHVTIIPSDKVQNHNLACQVRKHKKYNLFI